MADQPRVPAGSDHGGEFASKGGAAAGMDAEDIEAEVESLSSDVESSVDEILSTWKGLMVDKDGPLGSLAENYYAALKLDPSLAETAWGKQHAALIKGMNGLHLQMREIMTQYNK